MFFTGVQYKGGRGESSVENYTKFWNKDPTKEQKTDNEAGLDGYTNVKNGTFYMSPLFLKPLTNFNSKATTTAPPSSTNTAGRSSCLLHSLFL